MVRVTVRNIDERDYVDFKELAKANKRSMAAELRALIADVARKRQELKGSTP